MERSEPSLVPEWLKGASGSAIVSPHPAFYQAPSSRGSSSLGRRNHGSSSVHRSKIDRENNSPGLLDSSPTRSSSFKQAVPTQAPEEQEGNRVETSRERDWLQDGERFGRPKDVEGLTRAISDERKEERDLPENGRTRPNLSWKSLNYEFDPKSRQLQSLGLSPRLSNSSSWKQTDSVSLPMTSASIQKSSFEREFPSLGVDDKHFVSSPIASPHPLRQTPLRSDLVRASSPGLMGNSSITSSINGGYGGNDTWNSVLVGTHPVNDNIQSNNIGKSAMSCSSLNPSYVANSVSISATNACALNMAEALSQPPPRACTPPQSSIESQRLEELALKQSRQLIPMTPSLPKTMSLLDKGKSKAMRMVDASRPSSSSKLDMSKHLQGKLLILKTNKDGGLLSTVSTNALKAEGNIGTLSSPHGSSNALAFASMGGSAQHTKSHGRKSSQLGNGSADGPLGIRTKDIIEDKRSSTQAQNRNDFFNSLRKKAAGNDENSLAAKYDSELKDDEGRLGGGAVLGKAATYNNISHKEQDPGSTSCGFHAHNIGFMDQEGKTLAKKMLCLDCDSSAIECSDEVASVDSEEEEAAFMRSLGWEENAEDNELTEEEINAFYQMRERRRLLGNEGHAGDAKVDLSVDSSDIGLHFPSTNS